MPNGRQVKRTTKMTDYFKVLYVDAENKPHTVKFYRLFAMIDFLIELEKNPLINNEKIEINTLIR